MSGGAYDGGGYHVAGLAYHARTTDLRSDRTDDQTLTTYGVALAESLPRFKVPIGSGSITILPACRAIRASDAIQWRLCSMTDLSVEKLSTVSKAIAGSTAGTVEGSYRVFWEDATWGYDYDMDVISRLEYCLGPKCVNTTIADDPAVGPATVRVKTTVVKKVTGNMMELGYTITGSNSDGFKIKSIEAGATSEEGGVTLAGGVRIRDGDAAKEGIPIKYTHGSSSAVLLENPLWYAAKYGGFIESDTTAGPNLASEWDEDGDGVPDTFFQVTNPGKLIESLSAVLSDVAARDASASAVTTNSTRLNASTIAFQAQFDTTDWSGQLKALPIGPDGSIGEEVWNAADNIPAHGNRQIFSWNPATGAGMAFDNSNISLINSLVVSAGASSLSADQINYLRGDRSNEAPAAGFRARVAPTGKSALGDIINSDPLFVRTPSFGYNRLAGSEGLKYLRFRAGSVYQSRPGMLYVGGSDGMLHAFSFAYDALNKTATGTETFSFIPNAVFGNLEKLTDIHYSHQYFVDGSPVFGDAYIDHDNNNVKSWRSVLVGTTGAGGAGVFALDITDPASFSASDVLWDIDSSTPGFADLGLTLGKASIVRMADGHFYSIFGNGYSSASGKAVLYLVRLDDPSIVIALDAGTTGLDIDGDSVPDPNGLSAPLPVDNNNDRIADAIYVGDLYGNLWKIDVSNKDPGKWDFSFRAKGGSKLPLPLFVAVDPMGNRQPISAQPEVGLNDAGGRMVYFGTGKYFENSDNAVGSTPQIHSFYAIRAKGSEVSRKELVEQTIDVEGIATLSGFDVRLTSDNPVSYIDKKGWFMDLKLKAAVSGVGERIVNQPILRGDRLIFTTLIPSSDPCALGGTSWLMEVDAQTGSRLSSSPFDLNDDGHFSDADKVEITDSDGNRIWVVVAGIQKTGLGVFDNPAILEDGTKEVKVIGGSSGRLERVLESKSIVSGRKSWQQLR